MKKLLIILLIIFPSLVFCEELIYIDKIAPETVLCRETGSFVYTSIIVKSGIVSEADYNSGMCSFISMLLLNQTKMRSPEELAAVFYSTGCHLSMEIHLDYLEIKFITHKDNFEKAIDIIAECLLEPKITQENIQKAKNDTIEKMTEEYDNTFQRMYDTLRQNIYVGNPYKRSILGTVQSVKSIDKNSVSEYFIRNFSPSNMVICIVGDLDKDKIREYVSKAFINGYKNKKRPIYDYRDKLSQNKSVNIVNYDSSDLLTYYVQGYFLPGVQDKDYYACLVLAAVLGEGKSSEVFKNIRQKYGIGYFIGFKYEKLRRQSHGYLYFSSLDSKGEKTLFAKNAFLEIMTTIKNEGISFNDLERAKTYIKEQYNIENLDYMKKAHNIAWNTGICGDFSLYESFDENIDKVSMQDIKAAADKYFNNYCEVTSTPREE